MSVRGFDPTTGELTGREFTAADLEAMLPALFDMRRERERLDGAYKTASGPVRAWLDAHPGEQLREGESGISATLQERRGSDELDVIRLAENRADLLLWLALHGCLRLDGAAWKALQGKAAETVGVKPFLMPGRGSTALIIDRERQ